MKKAKPRRRRATPRYGAARRLHALSAMLASGHGVTLEEIRARFGVSRFTAMRSIAALEEAHEPIVLEKDGRKNVYRLDTRVPGRVKGLSVSKVVAIELARQLLAFLAGTSFKDDLDDVLDQLLAGADRKTLDGAKEIRKKVHVVNDMPHLYDEKSDTIDALLTGLTRSERVTLTTGGPGKETRTFDFEPWTLVSYKKGLYVDGFSARHQAMRSYGLDALTHVEWKKGERFELPKDHDPVAHYAPRFGIFGGQKTRVRIRFAEKVARYVVRRRVHPSQRVETRKDGTVVLTMTVEGTEEIVSWVLGYGAHAEVLEPATLRERIADVVRAMRATYGV